MFQWPLAPAPTNHRPVPADVFDRDREMGDCLHVFQYQGRRVSRSQLDPDQWHEWQAEVNARLALAIGFLYGHFVRGVRRCVVDGIEPVDRAGDSIQLDLFEYVYHQIVRKEADWVARDLLRQNYRAHADEVARHHYDHREIGCLLLATSHAMLLDELIDRPLGEGDMLSGANTIIYLGKIRDGQKFGRGLYVAKHRGSWCSDEIRRFQIGEGGLRME